MPMTQAIWSQEGTGTPEDRARALVTECQELAEQLSAEHTRYLDLATAISGRDRLQYRMPVPEKLTPSTALTVDPATQDENLLYEIFDATMSSAASSPLIPTPQGRGALFSLARALRHAGRWLAAVWEDQGGENACLNMFANAFQFSWGAVRVRYDRFKQTPVYDPVRFDELLVSQSESTYGPLQTFRLHKRLPPGMLGRLYGLAEATGQDGRQVEGNLTEAWTLPIEGVPGRHLHVAGSGRNVKVLKDEPWDDEHPPLVIFNWRRLRMGHYDLGAVDQLLPFQNEMLNLNARTREILAICTAPRLLSHVSSQVQTQAMDSEAGRNYVYKGAKPEPFVWETNLEPVMNERIRCKDRAYESFGASQMTGAQRLPDAMRVDSSAAVREVKLMQDQRFLDLWTRFQEARMLLGLLTLKSQARYGNGQDIKFLQGKAGHWDKAAPSLEKKNRAFWSLKPLPATATSLAADRATIEEMTQNGTLSDQDRKYLAGHPDPTVILERARARVDDIDRVVEALQDGEFPAPDQNQDLEYGQYAVNAALAQLRGCSDRSEHLKEESNMVAWIQQAQDIIDQENQAAQAAALAQAAQAAQQQQGGGGSPGPGPGVPPTMAPLQPGQ